MERAQKSRNPERSRQELGEITDVNMHVSNLHDQDEDKSGEKTDLATGRSIDNSTDHGLGEILVVASSEELEEVEEMAESVGIDPDDEAARWLRENA